MKLIIKWILPIIQAVISATLLYLAATGGFLPGTYMALVAGLVAVLLIITFVLTRSSKSAVRILGAVLAILASGVLMTGAFYIHRVLKTLDQVSEEKVQTSTFVVSVKAGNAAQTIEETNGYRFGILSDMDAGLTESICGEIADANGDVNLQTQTFDSPATMAQALLDGEIDACVLNNAYTDILDEIIEDYSTKTRVIYEMEFETGAAKGAGNNANGTGADGTAEGAAGDSAANTDGQRAEGSLTSESFTVLISGIDVRGSISTTSRSDVNILMTVNPKTHQILLTTTPRDYYVYIPEVSGDMRDKLTHAGIYGIRSSMATLENVYGIPLDYYVRVNFTSLITIVDALGGVDVYSEYSFTSRDCSFQAGMNHMNGEQALAFSRARYNFASGDNQRGKNQEAVLTAIINKVTSPEVLLHADDLIETAAGCTQTSVSRDEISSLVRRQLQEGAKWDIVSQAATGTGDSQPTFSMGSIKLYVMWPNEDVIESLSGKMKDLLEMNN